MIKEFTKGLRPNDVELEEYYLDWFFLHYFGKGGGYWKSLPEDQLIAFTTLEMEKEQEYWHNWSKMFNKMFGK